MNFDKTILVTGGAGFIGSNYLNVLVPRYPQYRFLNIDCLTYAGSLGNIHVAREPNYIFIKADIRERENLEKIFTEYKPDHVIHFAAESHVDLSITNPHLFVETNVGGTHNLLYISKKYGLKRFHQISTDEVYGSLRKDDTSFNERTPLDPRNPYSASKAAAEFMALSYHKTFGLDVVITRSSNNFGPHQDMTKLIPLFISKLLKKEKVPLYGKGENIRDWLFVEDNVEAIDLVFHKGRTGEIYNIGGGNELRNIDIARKLLVLAGLGEDNIEFVTDRPGHDFRYSLDSSKIKNELGWKPKTSFDDGIEKTFVFYQKAMATIK